MNTDTVKICLFCKSKHVTHQLINQKLNDASDIQMHYICDSCNGKYFDNTISKIIVTTNRFLGMPLRDFLCSQEYLNNTDDTYVFQNMDENEITDFTLWMNKPIMTINKLLDNKTYITLHE